MADRRVSLLSHRINTLLLNAKSPFPSEVNDGHAIVRQWRLEQSLKLVRPDHDICDRDSDDSIDHSDTGGEAA